MGNPTTHVSAFDDSSPGWTVVGPERYGPAGGLWAEEATTNRFPNPRPTTVTAGATVANSAVMGRDTSVVFEDDVASWSFACPGAVMNEGAQIGVGGLSLAGGNPWSAQCKVIGPVGKVVRYWLRLVYSDASQSDTATQTVSLDGTWQSIELPNVSSNGTKTISGQYLMVRNNAAEAFTFNISRVQFEERPYCTSVAIGDMGDGYAFTGTAHNSASTRAASSASISPTGILDTYLGAIVFVATPTIETGAEEIWGELGEKLAGADHIRWGRDSTKHPFVEWSGNDSAYTRVTLTATVDAGDEHFYSIEWHVGDTDFRLYLDDDPSENDTIPSPQESYGAGDFVLEATAGGVIYGGLAICNERLTNDQRARLKVVMENRGNIETALDSKRGRYGFFQVRPKVE